MSEPATAEPSAVPIPRLGVQAVLRTDVGLVRSENQDFGTYTTSREEGSGHPGGRLLIVADGMGGHRGGATASRLAGETVKAQYLGSETGDIADALRDALLRANARIFSEAQANPDLRGMGTTTSALVVKNNQAWFGHVGDSRIYLVRDGAIRQLTEDHSLVASMVREGLLTAVEAETHPRRNVLQRSMGVSEDVDIDVSGPFDVQQDDVFILCSDGLHGLVKPPELLEIAAMPVDAAANEYIKRALERGAPDNVTVIVAKIVPSIESEKTIGDETLALDETQRDTAPMAAVADAATVETAMPEGAPEAPVEAAADEPGESTAVIDAADQTMPIGPTAEIPAPIETVAPAPVSASKPAERPAGGGMAKWLLLAALLVGGAAGAWMYWNHQQGASAPTTAPSSR
jgi:protein phosphatase